MTTLADQTNLIGGRYTLEKLIGEGGTGEVWRARHTALHSPVAIKFLHGSAAFRESTRKRFLTEARVAAQLNTRHAVKVFDFGVTDQGRPYLIMELLDGESLAERLEREGRLPAVDTVSILRLAARALDCAHALSVVHRDFKPENIFLVHGEDGGEDVKVVDFGVAKLVGDLDDADDEDGGPASSRRVDRAMMSFTRTGKSVGTPVYMAPEQVSGEVSVGPATDVWAIGVVAYECLTGHRPFRGANLAELFDRIMVCKYVIAHRISDAVPPAFDAWFQKACAPDPAKRFANASAAVAALAESLGVQTAVLPLCDTDSVQILLPNLRNSSPSIGLSPLSADGFITGSERPSVTSRVVVAHTRRRPKAARRTPWVIGVLMAAGIVAGASWWSMRARTIQTEMPASVPEPVVVTEPMDVAPREEPSDEALPVTSSASAASVASSPPEEARPMPPRARPAAAKIPAGKGDAAPRPQVVREPSSPSPSQPASPRPSTGTPARSSAPTPPPKRERSPRPASPFELPELGL